MTESPVAPATQAKPREIWIDSARGACVLAVVLFHVCLWQYLPMATQLWPSAVTGWGKVNGYLGALRMPLLMALSGMLARNRIMAGWQKPAAAVRAASSYYLYLVWLTVYFVFYLVVGSPRLPHYIGDFGSYATQLLVPETPLWYIFALALYVVVLTSVRKVPAPIVLGALALLSILVLATDPNWPMFEKVPENAIYFAVGLYGSAQLRQLVGRRRVSDLLIWLVVGAASIMLAKWTFGTLGDAIIDVARGIVFIVTGALVVVNLVRWKPLGRLGELVGRRTLQIYVFHAPLLMVVMLLLNRSRVTALGPLLQRPVIAVVWPLVLAAAVVAGCLLMHRLLLLLRLGFLFEMPKPVSAAITRAWPRRPVVSPAAVLPQSESVK